MVMTFGNDKTMIDKNLLDNDNYHSRKKIINLVNPKLKR